MCNVKQNCLFLPPSVFVARGKLLLFYFEIVK
jgi:hypothetical protein